MPKSKPAQPGNPASHNATKSKPTQSSNAASHNVTKSKPTLPSKAASHNVTIINNKHEHVGRPRVCLSVNGIQTTALIDTGSSYTLLSHKLYNRLPRITAIGRAPRLLSITGHELATVGSCHVKLGTFPAQVIICEDLAVDLLLGADVLTHCILDGPGDTFILGDQKYPMDQSPEHFSVQTVQCCMPKASSAVMQQVLTAYASTFTTKDTPVGTATLPPAEIHTNCEQPIRQQGYRLPLAKREKVEQCVEEMLRDDVIRPSDSPWASPITLVPKKDGTTRFCVDYRKLNTATRKDAHPLPHIQDIFDQLKGATVFSTLDLKSGYWQIPMDPDSIPKTAFTCHLGLFEFTRMPFGLTNAPAIFQRAMNKVLSGLIGKCCMVYIDDIVIFSQSTKEHASHVEQVLQRIKTAGLQLKLSKCNFELPEIELLGFTVSAQGIRPQRDKVQAISDLVAPTDVKGVRSFLGMVGYYRQCITGFATLALPLTELTKIRQPFIWGPEQQEAFNVLKLALVSSPILAHPDPTRPYTLYTDASDKAIGAILVQTDAHSIERVIAYLSHKLSGTQLRWPTIEKEAFAVVYALKRLHPYLWGAQFEIHTDHKPLKSLFSAEIRNTKLQRWAIQISEYGAPILYHPGKLNIRADMLSRIASVTPIEEYIYPDDAPTTWATDHIDPTDLSEDQREEFPDQWIEAQQDLDDSSYTIESGLLYTLSEPYKHSGRYPRLVLPYKYRQQVIDRCHEEVGHAGLHKSLARIQESYVWPGMRRSVRTYLAHCVHCNTLTPQSQENLRGQMPVPPCPFHTWGIDLVGPFTKSSQGNKYLLTCVDHLTGWAEAIPIPSKHNTHVWEALTTHIIARYGPPSVIVSDNGGEFTATAFETWLRTCGIKHSRTSPYHPQTNGKVERFNGSLQKLLLKISGGDSAKWENYLADAMYAYRISINTEGFSPYQQVFGQRPRLPRSKISGDTPGVRLRNIKSTTAHMRGFLQQRGVKYASKQSTKAKTFVPGTNVCLRVQHPTKGSARWKPGYQIVDVHGPALKVQHIQSGKTLRVNSQHVREIPNVLPYDQVDPLPQPKTAVAAAPYPDKPDIVPRTNLRYDLRPRPQPPSAPGAAVCQPLNDEWFQWCNLVHTFCTILK